MAHIHGRTREVVATAFARAVEADSSVAVGAVVAATAASLGWVLGAEVEAAVVCRAEAASSSLKGCPGGGRGRSWRREKKGRETENWLDGAVITPVIEIGISQIPCGTTAFISQVASGVWVVAAATKIEEKYGDKERRRRVSRARGRSVKQGEGRRGRKIRFGSI